MKTKKEKQIVVNKLRRGRGFFADVQISYKTHEMKRVHTPEEFMALATGRSIDRLWWTETRRGGENRIQVCLD